MQGSEFWEKVLLGSYAEDCIYHIIVPTIMCSEMPTWDFLKLKMGKQDDEVMMAQRAHLYCAHCGVSVEGQTVTCAIRMIAAKRLGKECFAYRIVTNSATFCRVCDSSGRVISNSEMQDVILDRLEMFSHTIVTEFYENDLSGSNIWNILVTMLNTQHTNLLKVLGRIDSDCSHCKKKKPKKVCSGCHYVRYCTQTCATRDWPKHKEECKWLRDRGSIFCGATRVLKI